MTQPTDVARDRRSMPAAMLAAAAGFVLCISAEAQVTVSGAGFEPGSAAAVIVKVPKPWYAPKAVVVGKMRDSVPQYEALPGLSYKVFTLAQADGNFGGIYLWKDAQSARSWFSPAWFERVEKERGSKGDVRYFEVPVTASTRLWNGSIRQSSSPARARTTS